MLVAMVVGAAFMIVLPTRQQNFQPTTEEPIWKRPEWVAIGVGSIGAICAFLAFLAAKRQASAAEDQVKLMNRQLQTSMRAYLDPQWSAEVIRSGEHRRLAVKCRFRNLGRTTATIQYIELTRPSPYIERDETMVFPEGVYEFRLSVGTPDVTETPTQVYWENPPTFIILGVVTYFDGFTNWVRGFHRIYACNHDLSGDFRVPGGSPFNNERELPDGKDELERYVETMRTEAESQSER
jgi:hypothetical protein